MLLVPLFLGKIGEEVGNVPEMSALIIYPQSCLSQIKFPVSSVPLPATNLKLIKPDVNFHNLPNLLTCVVITPFVQSAYILMVLQAFHIASPRA